MLSATKLIPGDRVAILSPAFAAPAVAPALHEQALRRLTELTGLIPVEYPTTRELGATPQARAADVNAAFADPSIRAILATIGGDDQILVVPHLDPALPAADPKPFVGYSDNTNILNWLWSLGVQGYYGGSTAVHLGPGPGVDDLHLRSLRALLLDGGELEITEPGESEDVGRRWNDPRSLVEFGERTPTEPWTWAGPARRVEGATWGGCLEVIDGLAFADRLPATEALEGAILLLETSEERPPAGWVARWLRGLGERGILGAVAAVVVARPPVSDFEFHPTPAEAAALRAAQRDAVIDVVGRYNPEAVVCVGPPFGHTRPQWILPYGGTMVVDGATRTIVAEY
ncbi:MULTISPECIES: LD-carboxypeptidase [unclassified Microbacterium]|uniref:LD-carboxypeptidase n=1 Tax=unclassified Microbacterium TaxID=2609290 RepID=UPI000CFD4E6A|nr:MULTISPECIES: LD-carboxypeptidase [unclassified Microbacterium]PQZ57467.1 LD-carboxypeptidase [Microbacterium sp. MYb43]PQZ77323.1 LD-carboxypeptidase [Microbacterium sp. MYb40]PRB22736.1 LD-carboxypeptidase [Microbacterium sp. MYb54]PRB28922.1 LD-carboxypeptidase [Microbacterium sp. MYb50]PRB69002.1 LD-carboxypeptidase [Microbacterium sp. MYb24]